MLSVVISVQFILTILHPKRALPAVPGLNQKLIVHQIGERPANGCKQTAHDCMNFRGDVSGVGVIPEQGQHLSVHSGRRAGDAAGVMLRGRVAFGVDGWWNRSTFIQMQL